MTFIIMTLLTGCTNNQNMENPNTVSSEGSKVTPSPTQTIPATISPTPKVDDINKTDNIIDEQTDGPNAKFYLGMSKEDLLSTLESLKIEVTNETEITSDENAWDWGNKVIDTENFSFMFDKDQILYEIMVLGEATSTTLGLKIGDSLADMEKLYGKGYITYQTDDGPIYEYSIGNHYLQIGYENDRVVEWQISKYKFDK